MYNRPSAIAMCSYCKWKVKFTGDSILEVATNLRRLVVAHVDERHPEKATVPVALQLMEKA